MPNSMMQWVVAGGLFILGILLGLGFAPSTDELEEQVAALQTQVAAVEEQAAGAAGQGDAVAAQAETLGGLEGQVAGLEGQVADLAAQLDEWADSLDATGDRLSAVEAGGGSAPALADIPGLKPALDELTKAVAGTESRLAGLSATVAGLGEGGGAGAAPATAGAASSTAAEAPAAAAPARPAGLDAPGVHEMGIGASAWLVEGQVSVALSRIDAAAVRVFVDEDYVMVGLGQTVTLRGLPDGAGPCSIGLKHIEGRTAFLALSCS